MATRVKTPTEHLYEQDFYAWAKAQADSSYAPSVIPTSTWST